MNIWRSNAPTKAPMRLWRKLNVWLAMRLYACVPVVLWLARQMTATADRMLRDNTVDPQQRLDLGDD
jgi:type IV secretory pathway VirB3-like protein